MGYQSGADLHKLLTPREHEVLRLILESFSNREIAEEMCVSVHTVESHVDHIFRNWAPRAVRKSAVGRGRQDKSP